MALLEHLVDYIVAAGNDILGVAFIASLFAAVLTSIGSLAVLFTPRTRVSRYVLLDIGMGFSSGVMTVASFTSLLIPAIELGGIESALGGFVLGALVVAFLNKALPHEHVVKGYEGPTWGLRKLRTAWLIAVALIIHNFPEGVAIGASSAYDVREGAVMGIAIGLQDVPEGFAVALPVAIATGSMLRGVFVGIASGFSEVVMAVTAAFMGSWAASMLPILLGFGAGSMIYVVSHEAIPESHRTGHEGKATIGFFAGFIIMLYLDASLS